MRRPSRLSRLSTALLLAATVALSQVGAAAAAPGPTIECGQLTAYVPPDPVIPTPGSIGIGLLTAWEITPSATVSANAASALPAILNSGPTCLALELDSDGKVSAVDFAPQGTIAGGVAYDSGSGFYLFDDRLIVPNFITDAYPGLAALFVTSYQAGTTLRVTFSVDDANGGFTGFDGRARFCGKAGVASSGDGKVGKARIPEAVLSSADIHKLEDASGTRACARVHAVGVILPNSEGQIDVDTNVKITVATTRQEAAAAVLDTATLGPRRPAEAPGSSATLLILVLATVMLVATRPRAFDR